MKEKVVVCRQRLPWFNSEIKCAIRTRRKAERKWRRTKSQQDFRAFKGARNRATFVMNGARCEYYTNLIAENSSNQRNLFRTTKSLLCEPSEVSFPKDIAPDDLANDFGNFFMQKIDKIIVIRGDWLWKAANMNDKNNSAAVYVGSTLKVHNPLFSVGKLLRNKLMQRFYWSIQSKW